MRFSLAIEPEVESARRRKSLRQVKLRNVAMDVRGRPAWHF